MAEPALGAACLGRGPGFGGLGRCGVYLCFVGRWQWGRWQPRRPLAAVFTWCAQLLQRRGSKERSTPVAEGRE